METGKLATELLGRKGERAQQVAKWWLSYTYTHTLVSTGQSPMAERKVSNVAHWLGRKGRGKQVELAAF